MTGRSDDGTEGDSTLRRVPGREPLRAPPPKRFYKSVGIEKHPSGYAILLDGRPMKTPAKRAFAVPTEGLALAIAGEWAEQTEFIDPARMPLTRIANSAIDAVAGAMTEVAEDIAAYAASDLLCYRADAPRELAMRQSAAWDPVLKWAAATHHLHLRVISWIVPVEQPAEVKEIVRTALREASAFKLAALHVMTTITGSAILALAHAAGRLSAEETWATTHIDEDWQIEHWGADAEASDRRAYREREFMAASQFLALI